MCNQTHSLVVHCFQLSLLYVQNPDCSDHLPPPLRLPCLLVQCSTKTGITTRVVKRSSDPLHILLSAKPCPFRRDCYQNSPVTVFRLHLYRNAIDSEHRFEANARVYWHNPYGRHLMTDLSPNRILYPRSISTCCVIHKFYYIMVAPANSMVSLLLTRPTYIIVPPAFNYTQDASSWRLGFDFVDIFKIVILWFATMFLSVRRDVQAVDFLSEGLRLDVLWIIYLQNLSIGRFRTAKIWLCFCGYVSF